MEEMFSFYGQFGTLELDHVLLPLHVTFWYLVCTHNVQNCEFAGDANF